MLYTKFRTLTDEELLSVVQTARHYSQLIEELAGRFEETVRRAENDEDKVPAAVIESDALRETEESAEKPRTFSCPVCEAELLGSVNLIDDCFTIEIKQ